MSTNGETKITKADLHDPTDKLDLILEALTELNEQFEAFRDEVAAKFDNIELPGRDYSILEN